MKQEMKKFYEAPQLTVVTFKAERGYASSGANDPLTSMINVLALTSLSSAGEGYQEVENRGDADAWVW